MSDHAPAAEIASTRDAIVRLKANMRLTIKGKDDVIEQTLVCLVAGGHLLIEDLPGVGKTTLAYSLARSMDCAFSRIQFTSDLLPGDVTGVAIYDETVKEFIFKSGPVFANVVLADEINRATPKTQSALLEVMDRSAVTVDGEAHRGRRAVHGRLRRRTQWTTRALSAAREPDGPLPDAAADGLSAAQRRAGDPARARGSATTPSRSTRSSPAPTCSSPAGARPARSSSRTACSTTS
jgi:MoxR-like ATPase